VILGAPPMLKGGERIRTGVITALRPGNGGVLVQPDGMSNSYGWGYEELNLASGSTLTDLGVYWGHFYRTLRDHEHSQLPTAWDVVIKDDWP
jgi:hypothetical protein